MDEFWKPGQISGVENEFNHTSAIEFMKRWRHLAVYLSVFYVAVVFGIQYPMKNRTKWNLRGPLMVWNSIMAVFSILGFYSTGVIQWQYAFYNGWERSICDLVILKNQEGLFSFLFCFSKLAELIDTLFIVLRKQKLIFLHWYHHVTVLIYCWYSYSSITAPQQWFITMNYFIHSIMYSYYTLCASGVYRPHIRIKIVITVLQISQMIFGVGINIFLVVKMTVEEYWFCDGLVERTYSYAIYSLAMYASYFILFSHFFYNTYVRHVDAARVVACEVK